MSYKANVPVQNMGADSEELSFSYTFDQQCTILGCSRATLYMSTHDSNDMDVFIQIRKADKDGTLLQHNNIPSEDWEALGNGSVEPLNPLVYLGPMGCLRASYRTLDEHLSNEFWPEHDFQKVEKVKHGEVVKLDVGLWQTGMRFEPGEKLVVKVAGHNMTLAEFPELRGAIPNENEGDHRVHYGGRYSSRIVVPVVGLDC